MFTPRRLLRLLTLTGFVLLVLPANDLLTHTGKYPVILGRYSRFYFLFLIAYLGLLALTGLATWLLPHVHDQHLVRLAEWLDKLRAWKPLYWLVLISPWLLFIATAKGLANHSLGRSTNVQLSLLGLALLFSMTLVLAGRSSEQARELLARITFVCVSVALTLSLLEFALRRNPALIPDAARSNLPGVGLFLRKDLVFDKPVRVGFRYSPLQDKLVKYRVSDGDLYRQYRLQMGKIEPIGPEQDLVLAEARFVTDSNGYPNLPPLPDQYDLVVAGDSFTASSSVSRSWPRILEQPGRQSVLTLAVAGYGPQAEVEAVRLYGLKKQPSWVIVAYFEGNDLTNAQEYEFARASGLSWTESDLATVGPFRSSVALQTIRYGVPDLVNRMLSTLQPRVVYQYPLTASLGDQEIRLVFSDDSLSLLTASRADIEASQNYRLVSQAFLDLKGESEAANTQLLIVYIPTKEHVYLPLIQDTQVWRQALVGVHSKEIGPDGYIVTAMRQQATVELLQAHIDDQRDVIGEFTQLSGIRFLDLTLDFQARAAQGAELYYIADTHWTQDGHDLAAQLVADYITEVANGR